MKLARAVAIATLAWSASLAAQRAPGHSIGKVETIGDLIHIEVDSGALVPEHLFDLDHHTLRFTPDGPGYRVVNLRLQWDADFGPAVPAGAPFVLKGFQFPFSGQTWDAFTVAIGSITFGAPAANGRRGGSNVPVGNRTGAGGSGRGGFAMDRYASMQTVGSTFINMIAGIAAYVKPGLTGQRYAKELADRAVVTWTLTEPSGGIQAFSWTPTVNRIQAVLHKDGVIELSYNDVNAKDGVVGIFPMVTQGVESPLATIVGGVVRDQPTSIDVIRVRIAAVDGLFLKATFETRGPIPTDGGGGLAFSMRFLTDRNGAAAVVWTIRGLPAGRRGGGGGAGGGNGTARYTATGPGTYPEVTVDGNTISMLGVLPPELAHANSIEVRVEESAPPVTPGQPEGRLPALGNVLLLAPVTVSLSALHAPVANLSALTPKDGPFRVVYEGFHWGEIPRAADVACTVISALGDKFDFLASFSDFRVDNPEGGTPSTGPRGGNVTGIGSTTNGLANYCSQGRLQWMYDEPVSTSAVQTQENAPDGRMKDYNYAMSQIGHELAHRWMADADALVNGERIPLGPVHWATGLQVPAAFPYSKPIEADAMGGGVWKDNGNGTFTQLDDDYYVPANGYSWLDLYLMGFAKPEEVPDFFIIRNLQRTAERDADGHPIYRGDRTNLTIQNVIAAMGPRTPDVAHSQKAFTTGMVVMTLPGKRPSPELIAAANAIAAHWLKYWSQSTGGRSTMTTSLTARPPG